MENESIFKEHPCSISFQEVRVHPSHERFYQMYRNGNPTCYVYSESVLAEFLNGLELKFLI